MESSKEFSRICRFCTGTESLQNLFENTEVLDKIAVITDLEIQEFDQLPQQICDPCVKMVIQSHSFRLKCHQIDEHLRDILNFENSFIKSFSEDNDVECEKTFPMIYEESEIPHNEVLEQKNLPIVDIKIEFLALDSNFEKAVATTEEMDNEVDHLSDVKTGDISSSKPKEVIDTFENSTQEENEEINFNQNENTLDPTQTEELNNLSIKRKPGLKIFTKCRLCLRVYTTKTIPKHMKLHTDDDVACSLCDVFEINKWTLRSHIEDVHNLNSDTMQPLPPRKCPKCKKVFTHRGELKRHLKIHKKQFKCEVCKQMYGTQVLLNTHQKVHIGQTQDGRYSCHQCEKLFFNRSNMLRHIQSVHCDAVPFECNICSAKFPIKERLKVHLMYHEKRGFMCDICGECFFIKAQLKAHITAVHKNNKPYKRQLRWKYSDEFIDTAGMRVFKCSYCSRTCANKFVLEYHETTHTGLRRYACDECDMRFKQPAHLKTHKKTHTGERPFMCKFCGKTFSSGSNQRVHERLHTGERPYVCDICEEGFVASNALKRHKRVKHPEVVENFDKNKNTNK